MIEEEFYKEFKSGECIDLKKLSEKFISKQKVKDIIHKILYPTPQEAKQKGNDYQMLYLVKKGSELKMELGLE
ncbi:hypothetical protein LCGC14_0846660 [marine sediment metagenome]|uniref:Uncharacterized protein n=1 Tax=marine sediment metagenome TaxID=412755 RepID=A0A0F9SIM7_9ZZZZ